jgi:hypothetical protein
MLNIFMKVDFTRSLQNLTDRAAVSCVGYKLDNHRTGVRFTAEEIYHHLLKRVDLLCNSPSLVFNGYQDTSLGVQVAGA